MEDKKRIVIVGGVAGGASAAAKARRISEDAEIHLFERGANISFANCGLPYHIGGDIPDRERLLVQTAEGMEKRFNIKVHTRTEVKSIDREKKCVLVEDLETGESKEVYYDNLVLSPGAEPFRLPVPGADAEGVCTLRNLEDMDAIIKRLDEQPMERAVVIGGGYIGLEMAEALRKRKIGVVLVELARQVMQAADPEMVSPIHQQLALHGVDLRLGASVNSIQEVDGQLDVELSTGESVYCGMVVMAVGVRPEVHLAREAGLQIGERGGITVDKGMRTSDPDIYAVGDAVEVNHLVGGQSALIPLAGPANRQGRIAAENIFGASSEYKSTQGTAICKVFDLDIAMTGKNEEQLRREGVDYEKVYIHPSSHAGYYPGAVQISMKLLFCPKTGAIYGAQAVGADGVDKRIDVLATAIRSNLTVEDLAELELCYAPPYGSAKDPVNYLGFVASHVVRGEMVVCHTEDVLNPQSDQYLLDVRTAEEAAAGIIPGAMNIPVDSLRERIGELPKDKEILVYCQVGLRGYLATCILNQKGFKTRNLTGGYKTFKAVTAPKTDDPSPTKEITDDTGTPFAEPVSIVKSDECEEIKAEQRIDARGLQCPGPIMRLKNAIESIQPGQAVEIAVSDPGFPEDAKSWCQSTGHRLVSLTPEDGAVTALIAKRNGTTPAGMEALAALPAMQQKKKSIIVFSSDFDKAMASFIIANGAASMGSDVTLFFTFWGLNILRKPENVPVHKNLVGKMFGWMMPRGADKTKLSHMNMGGMGLSMIKSIMRKNNVPSLPDLIRSARDAGVRLVACTMTMDLMGIRKEELIDGVEEGGVAMYLNSAEQGNVNLFI